MLTILVPSPVWLLIAASNLLAVGTRSYCPHVRRQPFSLLAVLFHTLSLRGSPLRVTSVWPWVLLTLSFVLLLLQYLCSMHMLISLAIHNIVLMRGPSADTQCVDWPLVHVNVFLKFSVWSILILSLLSLDDTSAS